MSTNLRSSNSSERILDDNSPFAVREAFNLIRTNLMYTRKDDENGNPVYAITSAGEATGKSTNIANIALLYSKTNKKVLVIDADMRCPVQNLIFGLDNDHAGLSDILSSIVEDPNEAIRKTKFENLDIITSGAIPPNPSELLLGTHFSDILYKLRHVYDVIFVDFPPTGIVTDAITQFESITGYIFVVRSNHSDSKKVCATIETMEHVGAKIVGIVLNDVNIKTNKSYYRSSYSENHYNTDYRGKGSSKNGK